jgi:hypothetical protein
LLFGTPTEQPCNDGQNAYNQERNISDPRSSTLRIRRLLQRLFGLMQCLLALGLGFGHHLELLALGVRSCLRLLFARADKVEVQGRRLGCILGPSRRPGFCLGNIVA